MSLSREEIIRMVIGTARENGQFRRCFLTDQDLEKIADIAYAAGAAAEREACAEIVDNWETPDCGGWHAGGIVDAIRARGDK